MTARRFFKKFVFSLLSYGYRAFNPVWEAYWNKYGDYERWFDCGTDFVDSKNAFAQINAINYWGSEESESGPGSTMWYTRPLRKYLPDLFEKLSVSSILDAPCGDLNWISRTTLPTIDTYYGWDLVIKDAANRNLEILTRQVAAASISTRDVIASQLPSVDIWMCRDLIFHLPNQEIFALLDNFAASNIQFLLTTHFKFLTANEKDINAGGFRFVNLELPPYSLGAPVYSIPDFVAPQAARYLSVWTKSQVMAALANRIA